MGFKVKQKELVLKFSDEQYEGLEITARQPTIKESLAAEKFTSIGKVATAKEINDIFAYVAKFIIKWNIEDDNGKVLPINAASLIDLPADFAWAIVSVFTESANGVSDPLEGNSVNGETSQELQGLMEAL